jgi:AraC-type DNA-binding domain-containing proteins
MPHQNFPVKIFKRETNRYSIGCEFHWHQQIEFYYVERGGLLLLCNGDKQWLYSDDIAVVNCYEPHRGFQFMDNTVHYCIQMDLSILSSGSWDICHEKYIKPLITSNASFTRLICGNFTLVNIFKTIIKEYQNANFGYELCIKSNFMNLFTQLFRDYYTKHSHSMIASEGSLELKHITKIISYIAENFNNQISLDELTEKSSLSMPYMCKIFKKYTGSTIIEYIHQLRCQRALSLIEGGYSITDAALSVGFNDSNYFSRIFKRIMGTSPTKAAKS